MDQPKFLRDWERDFRRRSELRHGMMRRLEIVLPNRPTQQTQQDVLYTVRACTSCSSTEACLNWLGAGGGSGPPAFCPAKDAFSRLMQSAAV